MDTRELLRRRLANYAHVAWASWMRYMFSKSCRNDDGSVTIPASLAARWRRQVTTPYADLSPSEKYSALKEADTMLKIMDSMK